MKLSHNEILLISLILACSLSISFILDKNELFKLILKWNFFLFLFVFKLIEILYHLFSFIFDKIILLFLLLSDKTNTKFISTSIFNKSLLLLLNIILNKLLNIRFEFLVLAVIFSI